MSLLVSIITLDSFLIISYFETSGPKGNIKLVDFFLNSILIFRSSRSNVLIANFFPENQLDYLVEQLRVALKTIDNNHMPKVTPSAVLILKSLTRLLLFSDLLLFLILDF